MCLQKPSCHLSYVIQKAYLVFFFKKWSPHVFNFGSTQVNTLQLVKVCKWHMD